MLTELFGSEHEGGNLSRPPVDDGTLAVNTSLAATPAAVSGTAVCAHCGLRTDPALPPPAFCCSGCRVVYEALHDAGLKAYYQKREALPSPAASSDKARSEFAHFDDPEFSNLYTRHLAGSLRQVELYLSGVHCATCVWVLERLPRLLPGVHQAELRFSEGLLTVTWDSATVSLSNIAHRLTRLGYPPHPADARHDHKLELESDRLLLARIGVAGAAFGNVMLMSFALYSAEYAGVHMADAYRTFFRWGSMLLTVPSVVWTAWPFFRGALGAVASRTPHMDLPVSIGIMAALMWGTLCTLAGHGEIYFDSVTMLVFLLLVGRLIQTRQHRRARHATDLLLSLSPSTSRIVEDGRVRVVPTGSVPRGGLVEVRSGERIGIDGTVERGASELDESLLTGESAPRPAAVGSSVAAGTVNLSNPIWVRAEKTGSDTRLGQLVRDMERVSSRRARVVLLADRLSARFVVVVLLLALFTFALWLSSGVVTAVDRAVALLIVTCPCALGLATPLAAGAALGKAAKGGILVKGMSFLELVAVPGLFVFDKTGTLTQGKLSVVSAENMERIAPYVWAAEAGSAHPVARALLAAMPAGTVAGLMEQREEILGQGVAAMVDGKQVRIGSAQFVRDQCVDGTETPRARTLLATGLSPVYVVIDGRLEAVLGLGDPLRLEAADSLRRLIDMGYRLAVLSGDRHEVVQRVVAETGVEFELVLSEQSPEQKLAFIQSAGKTSQVYMVGDGVNDAAALSASKVGIAICGGAEASLAAADVFANREGLAPVVDLVVGARRTLTIIKRNMLFSLGYNTIAAALAIAGIINPLIAAILMPLSSLTVVANSLRSRSFDSSQTAEAP